MALRSLARLFKTLSQKATVRKSHVCGGAYLGKTHHEEDRLALLRPLPRADSCLLFVTFLAEEAFQLAGEFVTGGEVPYAALGLGVVSLFESTDVGSEVRVLGHRG